MISKFKKVAMDCQSLIEALRAKFGQDILRLDIREHREGTLNEVQSRDLWIELSRSAFRPFVESLFEYDFVDFHVISGDDLGIVKNEEGGEEDAIVLNYHLSLFQRARQGRVGLTVSIRAPKSDLSVPSIFDLLPGSEYSEREMREMFGIEFVGLPNTALVFLPEDWNEEIKPWRRDSAGPAPEDVRELS
ncbi:MAG: NADH-quinone oxidoreductase subunit C [Synergistaceae bacterium]|nr:NADH-quinone oxidoreductase subunit C [Synergistaceae bacterium]